MKFVGLLPYYISWHYTQAVRNIISISRNIVWFLWHFFSINLLLSTLFLPWQKIQDDHVAEKFDFGGMLATFIINTLMRIAGALIRLFMIVVGAVAILGTLIAACISLMVWLLLPVCAITAFCVGVAIIFNPS